MGFIDDIVSWMKGRVIYMTGRGLVGTGILLAAWAVGLGEADMLSNAAARGLMFAAVVGTAAVQGVVTWRSDKRAERQLLVAYRDEVGTIMGIDPKSVSIEQLNEVANGIPEIGYEGNSVIKEALEHNSKLHMLQFVTAGLSGLVTLGIAMLIPSLGSDAAGVRDSIFQSILPTDAPWFASTSIVAGSMIVAGTGMGILNQAFDRVGERVIGINKDTAHDLILGIRREIARGRMVGQEQVFGVFVAANADLAAQIEGEFGKPYDKLNQRQQHIAVEQFSKGMPTSRLTYELNHYMIDPEELAFAAVGQESGVPKRRDVDFKEEAMREKTKGELIEEVKQAILDKDREKPRPVGPEFAANDNQNGFAERFVPREGAGQSFVERYAPAPRESQLERVLEQARIAQDTKTER